MTLVVPDPVTVTPPAAVAVTAPLLTVSVTVIVPLLPSATSDMARPVRLKDVSSLVV